MTAPELPPWRDLAGRALTHAAADRIDTAMRCVERIAREHGEDQIPRVMLAWIDTAWGRLFPDGLPDGYLDQPMAFWKVGEGHTQTVDEVPPNLRWAGRFIFSRLSDDEGQALALINSVRDEVEWSAAVFAVLDVCAANLRLATTEGRPST